MSDINMGEVEFIREAKKLTYENSEKEKNWSMNIYYLSLIQTTPFHTNLLLYLKTKL